MSGLIASWAEAGPKGMAVRHLKRYASWGTRNVVRQVRAHILAVGR